MRWMLWGLFSTLYVKALKVSSVEDIAFLMIYFNHQIHSGCWAYFYPQLSRLIQASFWGFFLTSNLLAVILTASLVWGEADGWTLLVIALWATPVGLIGATFTGLVYYTCEKTNK